MLTISSMYHVGTLTFDIIPDFSTITIDAVAGVGTYKAAYFRFIRAAIPPTNNPAEQTIRKVVLDRKVTQGTRSDWGNRWLGRFWSIQTTCEQKGRNLLDYMTKRSSTISEVSFPYRSFIPDYHKLDILSVNDYLNLYWIPSHLVTFRNENILKTKGKSTLREIKIIF